MSHIPSIEAAMALNGRILATLSPDDSKVLEFYREQGRKYGVAIATMVDPAELIKATSKAAADEIIQSVNRIVTVKRFTIDEAHRASILSSDTRSMVSETTIRN